MVLFAFFRVPWLVSPRSHGHAGIAVLLSFYRSSLALQTKGL
jgi:hypothetical protein